MKIGKVIIDIASSYVDKIFDYVLPDANFEVGMRLYVPFGKVIKEGYLIEIADNSNLDPKKLKKAISAIDPFPVVNSDQLELAKFLKQTYHIGYSDSFRLFLPSEIRTGKIKELIKYNCHIDKEKAKEYLNFLRKNSTSIKAIIEDLLKTDGISQKDLNKKYNSQSLKRLIDDGIVNLSQEIVRRSPYKEIEITQNDISLTPVQQSIVDRVTTETNTYLLHGVTGSGKTEVYIHAMKKILERNQTGIMLVPEISLTPQVLSNFRSRFGNQVAIIHSGLSAGERYDEWQRILLGEAKIVIGARSAIFVPLKNIGLIVVDEEHDGSYVSDSNPRYNAIEVAKYRAKLNGASVILGSATPSLISYHHAMVHDYQLLEMKERINKQKLPPITIVDMTNEVRLGNNGIFSASLKEALKRTIESKNQAMLFINRRGYASFLRCKKCGWIAKCDSCDVSLVYHKFENRLKCHYCGAQYKVFSECPECHNTDLSNGLVGTEQVVEELEKLFPNIKIGRMDNDTTKTKNSHLKILSNFREGKTQILVGTQMIAKGHDFPSVTLVGIINADVSLYQSSYCATEDTFALITQVAGRAGRADKLGEIYLQTNAPNHYVYKFASFYDYPSFYKKEINLREATNFPPFSKIIRILFTSEDETLAKRTSKEYYNKIRELQSKHSDNFIFLGAMKPFIGKIQNKQRIQIIMRLKDDDNIIQNKIFEIADSINKRDVAIFIDINPKNLT